MANRAPNTDAPRREPQIRYQEHFAGIKFTDGILSKTAVPNQPRTGAAPTNPVRGSGAEPGNQSSAVRSGLVRHSSALDQKLYRLAFRDLSGSWVKNQRTELGDPKHGLDEHK
ncbi:MAG: hypothetical protein K2X77_17465 [Candidatus Obscuribacterales bacterium]|nr:hypothetical protein [Candidatus Obscuribacterales bacterium]